MIHVDAGNVDAKLSEAGSSNESYITSTNYGNMHVMAGPYNLAGKILRVTRNIRVTRKVNSSNRSIW
jgi:hypothetical protein